MKVSVFKICWKKHCPNEQLYKLLFHDNLQIKSYSSLSTSLQLLRLLLTMYTLLTLPNHTPQHHRKTVSLLTQLKNEKRFQFWFMVLCFPAFKFDLNQLNLLLRQPVSFPANSPPISLPLLWLALDQSPCFSVSQYSLLEHLLFPTHSNSFCSLMPLQYHSWQHVMCLDFWHYA
ncbi:hypothetical protein DsansV1_C30g0214891 [Dioscorea sansibarensis]